MKASHRPRRLPVLLLTALLGAAAAPAAAQQGGQTGMREAKPDRSGATIDSAVGTGTRMGRKPLQPGAYFNDRSRAAVVAYYAGRDGKSCQLAQARENNGCMAPAGASKSWQIGEALPATVTPAAVPQPIAAKLPRLPPGHRYVDAGGDILLIATASKMVVDGINGLMR